MPDHLLLRCTCQEHFDGHLPRVYMQDAKAGVWCAQQRSPLRPGPTRACARTVHGRVLLIHPLGRCTVRCPGARASSTLFISRRHFGEAPDGWLAVQFQGCAAPQDRVLCSADPTLLAWPGRAPRAAAVARFFAGLRAHVHLCASIRLQLQSLRGQQVRGFGQQCVRANNRTNRHQESAEGGASLSFPRFVSVRLLWSHCCVANAWAHLRCRCRTAVMQRSTRGNYQPQLSILSTAVPRPVKRPGPPAPAPPTHTPRQVG